MATEMSRIDVVGQNGNDGLHYCEELDWYCTGDVGDEQHHVDKRIEPIDQRPATAHYWSPGAPGYVSGWYKVLPDGEWWFWRTDMARWLHTARPEDAVLNNLVPLPPLDTATHVIGSYYFRLGQHGWERWKSGSRQWIGCMAPNPASVDRVIHPGLTLNRQAAPDSSDHIADAGKMIEGDPVALEAKRQQLKQDNSGDANKMVGIKHDTDKPRFDLIPPMAELAVAHVLRYGADKYAPGNWALVENGHERYMAAALRHLNAYRMGEPEDIESGYSHLAHAICCLLFILEKDESFEFTEEVEQ
jgi:hypothetical protein